IGYSGNAAQSRAFIWSRRDGMQDLGTLPGGSHSRALAINNRGDVVGNSESSFGGRAFLWQEDRGIRDRNGLVAGRSGFLLVEAVGVNDEGVIAALGIDSDGHENGCSAACACSRREDGTCKSTCQCGSNAAAGGHHDAAFRLFLLYPTR